MKARTGIVIASVIATVAQLAGAQVFGEVETEERAGREKRCR